MKKKLVFDSCIVIDFFKDKPTIEVIDIVSLLAFNDCFIRGLGFNTPPLGA
jgi:hypothetical protein